MKAILSLMTSVPGFTLSREHALLFSAGVAYLTRAYPQVELFTDVRGLEIADALRWDVTSFNTLLEKHFPAKMRHIWMLPKIAAQEAQTEPFFHVDLDFWLHSRLSHQAENAPLACQSKDTLGVYREPYVTPILDWCGIPEETVAFNTGLILWNDLAFKRAYVAEVLATAEKICQQSSNGVLLSIVLEQALLGHLARERGVKILELAPLPKFTTGQDMPHGQFTHWWGRSKKNPQWMEKAEARFAHDFPAQYANALRGFAKL